MSYTGKGKEPVRENGLRRSARTSTVQFAPKKHKITPKLSSKPRKIPKDYQAEYKNATDTLYSLLWGFGGNSESDITHLEHVNSQISLKNRGKKRNSRQGQIDIDFFYDISKRLYDLAIAYIGEGDETEFRKCQQEVREKIAENAYPQEWNLHDDDFDTFVEAISREQQSDDSLQGPSGRYESDDGGGSQGGDDDSQDENGGGGGGQGYDGSGGDDILDSMFTPVDEVDEETEIFRNSNARGSSQGLAWKWKVWLFSDRPLPL
jgi:hypothetical protein